MSSEATIANTHAVDHADASEATALKVFVAIVALVIGAAAGLGLTFGLAGIGALAICAAGVMLLICVMLTAG